MKLIWFEIHGFKRFSKKSKINLEGKTVAIIGPNEAGKTSLLDALQHFNEDTPFEVNGPSQETTRGVAENVGGAVIEATYALDAKDREAISDIPEAANTRWYTISKHVAGKQFFATQIPQIKRDRTLRRKLLSILKEHASLIDSTYPLPSQKDASPVSRSAALSEEVRKDPEVFSKELLGTISELKSIIRARTDLPDGAMIAEGIDAFMKYESREDPDKATRNRLYSRRPKFLLFSNEDRQLASEYQLRQYFLEQQNYTPPPIPQALRNLADSAGISLKDLYAARIAKDEGKVETIIERGNAQLQDIMGESWSQSNVSVRLRMNEESLHIVVGNLDSQYVRIAERSDGLRQFVALLAFLRHQPKGQVPPILLIDEAELHLHYDAQADLIQMLSRQQMASQVIYTTHSVGCLPEDLGSVRLVQPQGNFSCVENWFWDSDRPGFSRLLFGIGASTLAFVPVRYALFTEGAADMLLLPSLFREVFQGDCLGFQIVPGLSSATEEQVAIIHNESPRTAYLVDGDEAGNEIRAKLVRAAIAPERILVLPSIGGLPSVVEDFVSLEKYVDAVNAELSRSHGAGLQMTVEDLSSNNRPGDVEKWCALRKIKSPSKRAVAYQILDSKDGSELVEKDSKGVLLELLRSIRSVLGLA